VPRNHAKCKHVTNLCEVVNSNELSANELSRLNYLDATASSSGYSELVRSEVKEKRSWHCVYIRHWQVALHGTTKNKGSAYAASKQGQRGKGGGGGGGEEGEEEERRSEGGGGCGRC